MTSWPPLTHHPKLPGASRWVKEEVILPLTHIARETRNPNSVTSTNRIPEPHMLHDGLYPEHISKMANRLLELAHLRKRNIKSYYNTVGVRGELEWNHIEKLKNFVDEGVTGKGDPYLQDRLAEGHVIDMRKIWSLARATPASYLPQPILASCRL